VPVIGGMQHAPKLAFTAQPEGWLGTGAGIAAKGSAAAALAGLRQLLFGMLGEIVLLPLLERQIRPGVPMLCPESVPLLR
jgi:hypothetical protein